MNSSTAKMLLSSLFMGHHSRSALAKGDEFMPTHSFDAAHNDAAPTSLHLGFQEHYKDTHPGTICMGSNCLATDRADRSISTDYNSTLMLNGVGGPKGGW
mmetsp:Transcript_41626/g.98678  ORF Transcript_41626/g.98678 Transcript_41626/m.98678 type:complete len:100 (-) Transcript_41626:40-339(-)|eukprot:CAMPEP_0180157982 /NCGR_PEP_ID=MMETSP0986-20121125/26602_1 /TAXON_ID=697907 /ORGANISM="non described non described, Strain CCMP2293" /LENGTH=99 /DNA_ID=CAMNT_0022107679 /DNA_START=1 /DNA_END=300 /DNA_ORIENTATION=+